MFCGDGTDGDGDHWVWVGHNIAYDNNKGHWNLNRKGNGSYELSNAKYTSTMFCGDRTDEHEDHWAWVGGAKPSDSNKDSWTIEH